MDIKILRTIPLSKILEDVMNGKKHIDDNIDPFSFWMIDTGDTIKIEDQCWFNFNREKNGVGIVSLLEHWLEIHNISNHKISSDAQKIIQPIYNDYEKIQLKNALEKSLNNESILYNKIKI